MASKLCKDCGQPMLPRGMVKRHNEYDHAQGCPSERDPRVDPKVGDVLYRGRFQRSVQEILTDGYIHYRRRGVDFTGYHNRTRIGGWKRWAKNAEVLHAAE